LVWRSRCASFCARGRSIPSRLTKTNTFRFKRRWRSLNQNRCTGVPGRCLGAASYTDGARIRMACRFYLLLESVANSPVLRRKSSGESYRCVKICLRKSPSRGSHRDNGSVSAGGAY
jgi:hypothetical protein